MITSEIRKTPVRTLAAVAVLAAAGLSLAACDAGPFSTNMDKTEDHAWSSLEADGAKNITPDWIPAAATDLKERVRTTGNERILSYAGTLAGLPATCSALPAGTKAVPVVEGITATPKDFLSTATLTADWWPAGQEEKTTTMCGKWWVSEADGRVYAFAPELTSVAASLKSK